jgi:aminoglycoside phosphotransferase
MKSSYVDAACRELRRRGVGEDACEVLAVTTERATVGSAQFVVKVDSNSRRLAWEVAAMARAAAADVPVPDVLEFRQSADSVLIMERVAGQPLSLTTDEQGAYDAGRVLRRLHAIQADAPHEGWRAEVLDRTQREIETLTSVAMLDLRKGFEVFQG